MLRSKAVMSGVLIRAGCFPYMKSVALDLSASPSMAAMLAVCKKSASPAISNRSPRLNL